MKKMLIFLIIFVSLIIFLTSLWPITPRKSVEVFTVFDKLLHIGAYGLLSLLIGFCRLSYIRYIQILVLIFLFSIAIEYLQYLSPGRSFSMLDVAANIIGLVFGFFGINLFKNMDKKYHILFSSGEK